MPSYDNSISITFITGLSNTRHALLFFNFRIPDGRINRVTAKATLPYNSSVSGSRSSDLGSDSVPRFVLITHQATPICKKLQIKNYFVVKNFCGEAATTNYNTSFFKNEIFFNKKFPDYGMLMVNKDSSNLSSFLPIQYLFYFQEVQPTHKPHLPHILDTQQRNIWQT